MKKIFTMNQMAKTLDMPQQEIYDRMVMQVQLSHAPNPDVRGGYWQEPVDSGTRQMVTVYTLAEASKVCRAYIERNFLGGGNWTGGLIWEGKSKRGGAQVGRVSYNGRVWDMNGKEIPLQ